MIYDKTFEILNFINTQLSYKCLLNISRKSILDLIPLLFQSFLFHLVMIQKYLQDQNEIIKDIFDLSVFLFK